VNPWSFSLALPLGAVGAFAWAAYHPSAQLFGPTIRHVPGAHGIALTFDDGPDPRTTPQILSLLEQRQVPATFFVIGDRVTRWRSLTAEIAARGHLLGNHTATHCNLAWLPTSKIVDELRRCQDAVATATGHIANLVRPPFGCRGPQLQRAVQIAGLDAVAMWSVSTRDWRARDADQIGKRLQSAVDGSIILMHDGDHRMPGDSRALTVKALASWLPRALDEGAHFVSLSPGPALNS